MADSYVRFTEAQVPEGRKTKKWNVVGRDNGFDLGEIAWYGAWRQYTFRATSNSIILNFGCLRDIADFCESRTKEHKGG